MIYKLTSYIKFLVNGKSKYNIHSPFFHEFIDKVLDHDGDFYCYPAIEHVRNQMITMNIKIQRDDLGAGSKYGGDKSKKVKTILKHSQSSPQKAQLLFRMVNYFNPTFILELGTSFGFTAAYLANANRSSKVIGIEGDEHIYRLAQKNITLLGIKNINLINASFESVLPKLSKYDFNFIYFDGNHTKKATLNYFSWALENVKENDVFIFDDIYWSKEMNDSWSNIVDHQKTTLTIDLFSIGVVFFNKNLSKENFKLIHKANFY